MGFLDKLWDETVAGPTPETGLARLRKHSSFPARSPVESPPPLDQVKVSRSITILRNNNNNKNAVVKNFSVDVPGSVPDSPSSSSANTPRTPLTPGTPAENFRRWRSMKFPAAADSLEGADQRSLTAYDWSFCIILFLFLLQMPYNKQKSLHYSFSFSFFISLHTLLSTPPTICKIERQSK